jgi:hypothetical protein
MIIHQLGDNNFLSISYLPVFYYYIKLNNSNIYEVAKCFEITIRTTIFNFVNDILLRNLDHYQS